jgi:hypothetical protein
MTNLQRQILIEIEDHWNHQMCYLVDKDRYDDADALYLEFVVDGQEPEDWMFLEDLDAVV